MRSRFLPHTAMCRLRRVLATRRRKAAPRLPDAATLRRLAIAFAVLAVLAAAAGTAARADHLQRMRLGILPFADDERLLQQFSPIANYLTRVLDRPVRLTTAPSMRSFIMRLDTGHYDAAFATSHVAALAIVDYGYTPIVKSTRLMNSVLYTRTDSGIATIADLRGRRIAMPDALSLQAILIERELIGHGLEPGRDFTVIYAATDPSAALLAASGKADAAVLTDMMMARMSPEIVDRLTPLLSVESRFFGTMVVAPHVDAHDSAALRQAMLAFPKSPEGLAYEKRLPRPDLAPVEAHEFKQFHIYLPLLRMRLAAAGVP